MYRSVPYGHPQRLDGRSQGGGPNPARFVSCLHGRGSPSLTNKPKHDELPLWLYKMPGRPTLLPWGFASLHRP